MSATARPRTQTRAAIKEVGEAFKHAAVALRKLRGRETHDHGHLSYAQLHLLFGLSHGCELSARELAAAAELTPGTVTRMLDGLESSGYVERTRSETDKRVVLTKLTDRGEQVLRERRRAMETHLRQALKDFSDEQLHAAAEVLNALARFFDQFE